MKGWQEILPVGADECSLMSRRLACALLASVPLGAPLARSTDENARVEAALTAQFALKRRAYQSGDAELLRDFYDTEIVIAGEGMSPLVGLEAVIGAYRDLLPKRRDIDVQPLRQHVTPARDFAYQFVRFTAFPRDPQEKSPIATFLFGWQRRPVGWRCIVELLLRQDLSLTPGFSQTASQSISGEK